MVNSYYIKKTGEKILADFIAADALLRSPIKLRIGATEDAIKQ
jgi:hypothetical protein